MVGSDPEVGWQKVRREWHPALLSLFLFIIFIYYYQCDNPFTAWACPHNLRLTTHSGVPTSLTLPSKAERAAWPVSLLYWTTAETETDTASQCHDCWEGGLVSSLLCFSLSCGAGHCPLWGQGPYLIFIFLLIPCLMPVAWVMLRKCLLNCVQSSYTQTRFPEADFAPQVPNLYFDR